jgi:hypothetical protein
MSSDEHIAVDLYKIASLDGSGNGIVDRVPWTLHRCGGSRLDHGLDDLIAMYRLTGIGNDPHDLIR